MKNLPYWLIAIILISIGIFLLYIDSTLFPSNPAYPTFSAILNKVATAVIITGLFSLLNTLILRKSLMSLIYDKIKLKHELDKAGVLDLFTDIRDIKFRDYFKNCKKEIDILHVYGQTWTSNHEQAIMTALKSKKCIVRVAILKEDSPFINGLADYYGYNEEKLIKKIQEARGTWQNIKSRLDSKSSKKRLRVYQVNMLPAYAMYRFDDTLIKIDTRLISTIKDKNLNALVCCKNEYSPSYYSNCMRDFEALIKADETTEILNPE